MPDIGDDNPLWKPGTYPHDDNDGTAGPGEFWAIKTITTYNDGPPEIRWLCALRTFAWWTSRIRFRSKTEARKWYWDTKLCGLQSYEEKRKGEVRTQRTVLVHVTSRVKVAVPQPTSCGRSGCSQCGS